MRQKPMNDVPSQRLVEIGCAHSRRASVRRHNEAVIRAARRRQRVEFALSLVGRRP